MKRIIVILAFLMSLAINAYGQSDTIYYYKYKVVSIDDENYWINQVVNTQEISMKKILKYGKKGIRIIILAVTNDSYWYTTTTDEYDRVVNGNEKDNYKFPLYIKKSEEQKEREYIRKNFTLIW